jgi:hypothetical protein
MPLPAPQSSTRPFLAAHRDERRAQLLKGDALGGEARAVAGPIVLQRGLARDGLVNLQPWRGFQSGV